MQAVPRKKDPQGGQSRRQDLLRNPWACSSSCLSMRLLWARPAMSIVATDSAEKKQIISRASRSCLMDNITRRMPVQRVKIEMPSPDHKPKLSRRRATGPVRDLELCLWTLDTSRFAYCLDPRGVVRGPDQVENRVRDAPRAPMI